jgi:diguanylate cyclase (GGDEF)-like protein
MAKTDPLTKLANRRAWEDELDRELSRAERRASPTTVALLDIDRFKRFNDAHGHLAGDDLLRGAAASWRAQLRSTDFIARYGGEEFAVLLSECLPEEAHETVERLREAVPMGQTCSVGVATWDGLESGTMLTGRADAALYEAKRTGRDRVVTATEPEAPPAALSA